MFAAARPSMGALLILMIGCGSPPETWQQTVDRYAQLSAAKSRSDASLQAALAKIEAAGHTPQGLIAPMVADESNTAVALQEASSDTQRQRLYKPLEAAIPSSSESVSQALRNPELVQRLRNELRRGMFLKAGIEKADARLECRFEDRIDRGFYAKLRFLDDVAIATRMALAEALVATSEGDLARALPQMGQASRWIQRLAPVRRVSGRVLMARLREDWLMATAAISQHERVQSYDQEQLYRLLLEQINNWPEDSYSLIGDRAITLHAYEAVRDGNLATLTTAEERAELEASGRWAALNALTAEQIDRDQTEYLTLMEEVLTLVERPYHQVVTELATRFDRFSTTGEARQVAPIASELFVADLPVVVVRMAEDRARSEAWALALAMAAQIDLPPFRTSPYTGSDYEIRRAPNSLSVIHAADLEPAIVRLPVERRPEPSR